MAVAAAIDGDFLLSSVLRDVIEKLRFGRDCGGIVPVELRMGDQC